MEKDVPSDSDRDDDRRAAVEAADDTGLVAQQEFIIESEQEEVEGEEDRAR